MKEKINKPLIPKLRFKEFTGEWVVKKLGEVCDMVASGDLEKEHFSKEKNDIFCYPVYSNSLTNKGLYGFYDYYKYSENSVTITARGEIGFAEDRNCKYMGVGRLLVLSDLKDINNKFVAEYINSKIKFSIETTGVPQLTTISAKNYSVIIPTFKEQNKISSLLSSLDELISLHEDKVTELKKLKKGLMQSLFPDSVHTHTHTHTRRMTYEPRLRFPQFTGEWEVKRLGDVGEIIMGQSPESLYYNEIGEGLPFYQGKTEFGEIYIKNPKTWTTKITKEAKKDDILMSVRAPVGTLNIANKDICIGRGLVAIRPFDNFQHKYIYYVLKSQQDKIVGSGGSIFDSIAVNEVKKIEIFMPKDKKEQTKIAAFLSSLDELITNQNIKVTNLKQYKKGLMQNIFPNTIN